jgi:hypothetical protein
VFAEPRPAGSELLIRNSYDRLLEGEQRAYLQKVVRAQAVAGQLQLEVRRRLDRPPRTAELQVRFCALTLHPPHHRLGGAKLPPVRVWAVHVLEADPPAGETPVEWLLLTTLEVEDLEAACRCVFYYSRRWLIERYHYTLKSGCRIEQSQLRSFAALWRLLELYCVVAWRLLWLTHLSRVEGEQPCTVALAELEWRVLYEAMRELGCHDEPLPVEPPRLREAVRWVAKLGGFIGRKGDGEPGVKVLWRGLMTLHQLVRGVLIARQLADVYNA